MIKIKPVFVETKNTRNYNVIMAGLDLAAGEGRLGMVWGRAGRGKTRTAQRFAAHNRGVYMRMLKVWRTSELDFLRTLAKELGVVNIPHRKAPCFSLIVDQLIMDPVPIFVDEIEKLPGHFLEVIRDLTDMSGAPIVLIGEEELAAVMQRNRRVWSRTYQSLKFEPIGTRDIIVYAKEAAGLSFTPDVAKIFGQASGGDFRIVRRDLIALVQYANAKQTDKITPEMAKVAVKAGLSGR